MMNDYVLSVGERLNDFEILIGNDFTPGSTGAAEIGSWSECAHFPGNQLFQSFVLFSESQYMVYTWTIMNVFIRSEW